MSQSTETIEPIADTTSSIPKSAARPTARQWLLHTGLFLITLFTTTICGVLMAGPDPDGGEFSQPVSGGLSTSILMLPAFYIATVARLVRFAFLHPSLLGQGLLFSGSLLA